MIDNCLGCCSIWAIVVLVLGLSFICYLKTKVKLEYKEAENAREHEKKMKQLSNDLEVSWFEKKNNLKELKTCTEEGHKSQVKELETKVKELEGKLKTEKFNKELLEKQLKMYSDIFGQLKVDIKPKA